MWWVIFSESKNFSRFFNRGDKIIEYKNSTENLLALSAIDENQKITSTIMNKEEKSMHFLYENGTNAKALSIPPRSIMTLVNK